MDLKTIILEDYRQELVEDPASATSPLITVYTPKNLPIQLGYGAPVIEFVQRVHNDFLPMAMGARVNDQMVGLLYPLADGDRVEIQFARAPRLLPPGWEGAVSSGERRNSIVRAFAKAYRPTLEWLGMSWLQRRLIDAGVWPVQDPKELDGILAEILPGASLAETYQEFGMRDIRGEIHSGRRTPLSDRQVNKLLLDVFSRAAYDVVRAAVCRRYPEISNQLFGLRICSECCTTLTTFVIECTDRDFVCHYAGAPCVQHSAGKRLVPLEPPPVQYFYITAGDRSGLVADLSAVFEGAQVKVSEFLCMASSSYEAEARVRIESISRTRITEVQRLLQQVAGVRKIRGPEDPVTSAEASQFPRRHARQPADETADRSPYDVGVLIQRSDHLYGRREDLRDLYDRLESSISSASQCSESFFVHGPFRSGKSSLVATAFANVKRVNPETFIGIRLEVSRGDSWHSYSARLARQLITQAKALGYQLPSFDELSGATVPTLDQIIQAMVVHRYIAIAIAVDEVAWLLQESHKHEAEEMAKCFELLRSQPSVTLIFIGPHFEYKTVNAELRRVLQTSRSWPIARMTASHCADIVCARKSRHTIHVDPRVLNRIYQQTMGNPYWTQLLADFAWNLVVESRSDSTTIRYTQKVLNVALAKVVRSSLYFAQNYKLVVQAPSTVLTRRILCIVMQTVTNRRGKPRGLRRKELIAELEASGPIPHNEIDDALKHLETIGTLVRVPMRRHTWGWLMPPILARHLRETRALESTPND